MRKRLATVRAIGASWDDDRVRSPDLPDLLGPAVADAFADALEEFDAAVSEPTLDAFLDELDLRRQAALARRVPIEAALPATVVGGFGIHVFGCSLATGEAEIASRGFFDALDRPPLELWIELVRRPSLRRDEGVGVGVLFVIPQSLDGPARAGCAACPSGALIRVDHEQAALHAQLAPLSESTSDDRSDGV